MEEPKQQQQQQQRGVCSFTTSSPMRLTVTSTTGCPVELSVHRGETAEGLRKLISHKLGLQTDRITVVHKERHLTAGTLMEQGVTDGSRLTLVPVIETGSASSTRERTVMERLENLTESQIDDFLSGRLPLTLSLGAGAHTMYVQLQLSSNVGELQGNTDSMVQTRCEPQTADGNLHGLSTAGSSFGIAGSQTSSPSSLQHSTQRPRTSFTSSTTVAPETFVRPSSVCQCSQPDSGPDSPLDLTHPPSLPHAATLVSSSRRGSEPGRQSPPAASTFTEGDVPAQKPQPPGAVIDNVVSHSPGVFSGTFSGTLTPCNHGGISHPRRGIAIILQILNDLLRAACHHQGTLLPALCDDCTGSKLPGNHLTAEQTCKGRNRPPPTHSVLESRLLLCSEENKMLHGKMERLQLLMNQRRRQRRIRRCLLRGLAQQHRRHHS